MSTFAEKHLDLLSAARRVIGDALLVRPDGEPEWRVTQEAMQRLENAVTDAPAWETTSEDDAVLLLAATAFLARFADPARTGTLQERVRDGWRAAIPIVRRALVERCAKVAESYEPRCNYCPRGVADAIRHLADKPEPQPVPDSESVCAGCGAAWGMRHSETCKNAAHPRKEPA